MVFSSLTFLFFYLTIVLILYFIGTKTIKNIILLISGLIFYAWGEPVYVVIMLFSTLVDYTAGMFMHKFDSKPKIRTLCLLMSVILNIGMLSIFKYSSFIITNINAIFGTNIYDPQLPLPIGISFYTFQSMSYTIDLYLRNIKVQKNVFSFTAYVSMFPQIVAGPIVRYEDVAKEIDDRKITKPMLAEGVAFFVKGLGKKVLLANNIGLLWTQVKAMDYASIPALTAWLGILAFTFQIYYDFSGYSDMAVGLGKMLGFNFPNNFNYPYISKSISEFWRRWHITLGSWFRSYVYIPLGGNRHGMAKTLRNLIIVWFLTGLWHGASWNFILWGLYFGLLIILERLFLGKILQKLPSFLSTAYTFILVVFGWVLFDIDTLPASGRYFKAMFGGAGAFADSTSWYLLASYAVIFVICIFGSTDVTKKICERLKSKKFDIVSVSAPVVQLLIMVMCTAYLVDATYNPFMYFRF